MNRRNRIGLGLAALALAALLYWALVPAPVAVESARVQRAAFVQTVNEQAKTRIRDHYALTAPLNGELSRISLREGDDVAAGSVLARLRPVLPALLDTRTELELRRRVEAARAAKDAADARVAVAGVALTKARLAAERSRQLLGSHLVAVAQVQDDELALAMATQELESAKAGAHLAMHDIDIAAAALARAHQPGGGGGDWPLLAPIDGRVLRVQQKSGGTVGVGAPLIELGDPANLEVLIELLTTDAPQVTAGARVQLLDWGGPQPLAGRVRRIEPWGFTKISALGVEEQRVNVLVDITSPRATWTTLGEGYRLDAAIEVYSQPAALTVPTGALFRGGAQWYVYRIDGGQRARRVAVRIGHRNDTAAEVLAGLAEGDTVVVYPGDAVREGVRVRAQPAPAG